VGQDAQTGAINLARTPPFSLANLTVQPATLQASRDGKSETLEPRVMQVLVALVEARGEILTRDDLIARCWGGRIVGDNAIHRAVSRVRDLAENFAEGSFGIETISKVGYRLILNDVAHRSIEEPAVPAATSTHANVAEQLPATRSLFMLSRGSIRAAGAIVALVVCTVTAAVYWTRPEVRTAHVGVISSPGTTDPALSRMLTVDLAKFARAPNDRLVILQSDTDADYLLEAGLHQNGERLRGEISLRPVGTTEVLWSTTIERPAADALQLSDQLARETAGVLLCALPGPGESVNTAALRLLLAACSPAPTEPGTMFTTIGEHAKIASLREITDQAPDLARGWGMLATVEAELIDYDEITHAPRDEALYASATAHWKRARSLDPADESSFVAEEKLIDRPNWAGRLSTIEQGLAQNPKSAVLLVLRSQVLGETGLTSAAIETAKLATHANPTSPMHSQRLISALAYSGFLAAANEELNKAERIWPGSPWLEDVRFRIDFRYGDPEPLIREIDTGRSAQWFAREHLRGHVRAFLVARADPTAANVDAAILLLSQLWERDRSLPHLYLMGLGRFGRTDLAFEVLANPEALEGLRTASYILFRPEMHAIQYDPRFIDVAARLGLVDFWRSIDRWPDFCRDAALAYDCIAEAARVLPEGGS
jgi:DNA-binding winged helix-turn-helix (wHTH) protein